MAHHCSEVDCACTITRQQLDLAGIHVGNIFGNIPPCNVAGIPQYQITIPGAVLFEDVLLEGIQHPPAWLVDILPNPPGFI